MAFDKVVDAIGAAEELDKAASPIIDSIADFSRDLAALKQFSRGSLTKTIAEFEAMLKKDKAGITSCLSEKEVTEALLKSALTIKKHIGQIDVIIHALGIMVSLPYILEEEEVVESLSLGAGNTGKSFDLETDRRIAEFKFINWRGGAEAIRQNQLFKDLFCLASSKKTKRKYLYLTRASIPLAFLEKSKRDLNSVLSKNAAVKKSFYQEYGERYATVADYYQDIRDHVKIIDLSELVPAFAAL